MKEMFNKKKFSKKLSKRPKNFYKLDTQSFSKNIKKQQKIRKEMRNNFFGSKNLSKRLRNLYK